MPISDYRECFVSNLIKNNIPDVDATERYIYDECVRVCIGSGDICTVYSEHGYQLLGGIIKAGGIPDKTELSSHWDSEVF